MSVPYTYYITHLPSGRGYYGVRYANRCHPSDLWVTYFTSSSIIWDLIKLDGKEKFKTEIRKTFETAAEAINWEHRVLKRIVGKEKIFNTCAWPAISEKQHKKSHSTKLIVGEDGLNIYQRAGLVQKQQRTKIDIETGLTFAELRKKRFNKTLDENGSREVLSQKHKEWLSKNENPTKRKEVRSKISNTLREGIASGRIKTTKGMIIPKISEKLKGNTAVKGYKWYNDGTKDFRFLPSDPKTKNLFKGRLYKNVELGFSYELVTCPHCGKQGGGGNMKRYHFDNCKNKS